MGFKMGAIVGFVAGYYLGAKAGRERYEQINTWIDQARNRDGVDSVARRAVFDDTADLTAGLSSN